MTRAHRTPSYDRGVPAGRQIPAAPTPAARPSGLRLLLVHAHPDDESILTAATMAAAVAAGHSVTLLTATRGEAGEVYPEDLRHLRDDPPALGAHRVGELAAAMAVLGVSDVRFLAPPTGSGGATRWVDSGMAGARVGPGGLGPADQPFAEADLLDTGTAVARVLREVRPHVVVTYDELGGYGHPDHVAAHRAATYGTVLAAAAGHDPAGGPRWDVPKVYWIAAPRTAVRSGLVRAAAAVRAGRAPGLLADAHPELAPAVDDSAVTTGVDGSGRRRQKAAAMAAHRSQLVVVPGGDDDGDGWDLFALTNRIARPVEPVESYRLVRGTPVPGPSGLEDDLFAGLDGSVPR